MGRPAWEAVSLAFAPFVQQTCALYCKNGRRVLCVACCCFCSCSIQATHSACTPHASGPPTALVGLAPAAPTHPEPLLTRHTAALVAWRNRRATIMRILAPLILLILALLIDAALRANDRCALCAYAPGRTAAAGPAPAATRAQHAQQPGALATNSTQRPGRTQHPPDLSHTPTPPPRAPRAPPGTLRASGRCGARRRSPSGPSPGARKTCTWLTKRTA